MRDHCTFPNIQINPLWNTELYLGIPWNITAPVCSLMAVKSESEGINVLLISLSYIANCKFSRKPMAIFLCNCSRNSTSFGTAADPSYATTHSAWRKGSYLVIIPRDTYSFETQIDRQPYLRQHPTHNERLPIDIKNPLRQIINESAGIHWNHWFCFAFHPSQLPPSTQHHYQTDCVQNIPFDWFAVSWAPSNQPVSYILLILW